jgi:LuxR family transcriptional regulator, maltose regulon positive regulatory protein
MESPHTLLLENKLFVPPARAHLISRPRLLRRLNDGLVRPLTLVSAPAGFGKTTLLCDWINTILPSQGVCVSWLALDENDNDPARFLVYLIAALEKIEPQIGESARSMLHGSPVSFDSILTLVSNDLAHISFPAVLVLDDLHTITSSVVYHLLEFLLDYLPAVMHLVITTRTDPALPLARLRARDQLVELRQTDLRFAPDEAAQFINQTMGLNLAANAITALETRTEGWAAGLQLAALSLQKSNVADTNDWIASFAGDNRYIFDYLVEEVLCHQPAAIQTFLLNTAILNHLTASLCDALLCDVTLSCASQALLEQLDAANLFLVPLDTQRRWYRYHPLFAEALRYRLQREQPERAAVLHRRASQWYMQALDGDEAIQHALAIPDFALAAQRVEQFGMRAIGSSHLATYLGWIQRIPEETIFTRAYLSVGCAWVFVLTGQIEQAERYLQASQAALARFEPFLLTTENRYITAVEVLGHIAAVQGYCARLRGDAVGALEYARAALVQLPAEALSIRCPVVLILGVLQLESGQIDAAGATFAEAFAMAMQTTENTYVALSALELQGDILANQGNLRAAREHYQRIIELGKSSGARSPIPAVAMGYWGLARIYYERHDLKSAEIELLRARVLLERAGNLEGTCELEAWQAHLALAAGDLEHAQAIIEHSNSRTRWMIQVELALARNAVASAEQCLAGHGPRPDNLTIQNLHANRFVQRLPEYLFFPRVLLAQGQLDRALEMLTPLIAVADQGQVGAVIIEASALQAVTWHLKKNDARALEYLQRALGLAAPEEFNRPFIQAGKPMIELLRRAIAAHIEPDYVRQLLLLCEGHTPLASDPLLAEPLTQREVQIVRLLAVGLSSNEIATELVLAVSTVRSYIKTIYAKLDAHNRIEAIEKARQLQLL